jgi:hypothetical protein
MLVKAEKEIGIVYGSSVGGHRPAYLQLFARLLNLGIMDDPPGTGSFTKLFAANRVLFAVLDDTWFLFAAVAFFRMVTLRRTVGLLFRPHYCFETWRRSYPFKLALFSVISRMPLVTVATITPYEIDPKLKRVSHVGLTDPQYWDKMSAGNAPLPPKTSTSEAVLKLASGRLVIGCVGLLSAAKGAEMLVSCLEAYPDLQSRVVLAWIGGPSKAKEDEHLPARFKAVGGFFADRFVSDEEVESLYGCADLVWTCYPPDNDQASGVFGRSMQYGVTSIVRSGSSIADLARLAGAKTLEVEFSDLPVLAEKLRQSCDSGKQAKAMDPRLQGTLLGWRQMFVDTISKRL